MAPRTKRWVPLLRCALRDILALDIESLAVQFQLPRLDIYRVICNILEGDGRILEAVECLRRMRSELEVDTTINDERAQWELGEWLSEPYYLKADRSVSLRFSTAMYREAREAR